MNTMHCFNMTSSASCSAEAGIIACKGSLSSHRHLRSPKCRVFSAALNGNSAIPQLSERVRVTDAPIIVKTKQFMGARTDVLSLAQGDPLHAFSWIQWTLSLTSSVLTGGEPLRMLLGWWHLQGLCIGRLLKTLLISPVIL